MDISSTVLPTLGTFPCNEVAEKPNRILESKKKGGGRNSKDEVVVVVGKQE